MASDEVPTGGRMRQPSTCFLLFFFGLLSGVRYSAASFHRPTSLVHKVSQRGYETLANSVPAWNMYNARTVSRSSSRRQHPVVLASTRQRSSRRRVEQFASLLGKGGVYYGLKPDLLGSTVKAARSSTLTQSDAMLDVMEELRLIRVEMETMHGELRDLSRSIGPKETPALDPTEDAQPETEPPETEPPETESPETSREDEFNKLATEVELWAEQMINEGEDDGWVEVKCKKKAAQELNPTGRTTVFLKWMRDPRGGKADKSDENEYPCMKCHGIIDAPLEEVCTYLSQEDNLEEYNSVIAKHRVVEEISPSSKICWSQSPPVMFMQPREFITFCHHRWKADGTAIIVNQAMDTKELAFNSDVEEKPARGYALRGANIFTKSPGNVNQTRVTVLSHLNPGASQWGLKTAINGMASTQPFSLFHNINENIQKKRPQLQDWLEQLGMQRAKEPGEQSTMPIGIAQLGYACFWPKGGGVVDSKSWQASAGPPALTTEGSDTLESAETETQGSPVSLGDD